MIRHRGGPGATQAERWSTGRQGLAGRRVIPVGSKVAGRSGANYHFEVLFFRTDLDQFALGWIPTPLLRVRSWAAAWRPHQATRPPHGRGRRLIRAGTDRDRVWDSKGAAVPQARSWQRHWNRTGVAGGAPAGVRLAGFLSSPHLLPMQVFPFSSRGMFRAYIRVWLRSVPAQSVNPRGYPVVPQPECATGPGQLDSDPPTCGSVACYRDEG